MTSSVEPLHLADAYSYLPYLTLPYSYNDHCCGALAIGLNLAENYLKSDT